jgi:hypothetical protein
MNSAFLHAPLRGSHELTFVATPSTALRIRILLRAGQIDRDDVVAVGGFRIGAEELAALAGRPAPAAVATDPLPGMGPGTGLELVNLNLAVTIHRS